MVNAPSSLVAGETFFVKVDDSGFSALSLAMRGPAAVNANGDISAEYQFALDSTGWAPGAYQFEIWGTTAGGSKKLITRQPLTVEASLAAMGNAAFDARTQTEKIVDALEAKIAGIALSDEDQSVLRYKINNRELENYPLFEMRKLLVMYRLRLGRERRRARGLSGFGPSMKAHV